MIELRRKLLARDLDARCVIGGAQLEADLLAEVDQHLENEQRRRELAEVLAVGVGDPLALFRFYQAHTTRQE